MIKRIQIEGNDFETEIEKYFIENGSNEDVLAYEGHTIASVPFHNRDEEIAYIKNNCIVFEDDTNYYVAKEDNSGDFEVQVCKKSKYSYFVTEKEDD